MADVEATLRALPSHGPSSGWTERRDRALLVLSQVADLRPDTIVELTAGDITVADGVAVISTPGGTTTLRRNDDVLVCGPCALARWLHALDLTVVQSNQVAASVIARCAPLTSGSPHLCEGELALDPATRRMPVLPLTDHWGPHRRPTRGQAPTLPEGSPSIRTTRRAARADLGSSTAQFPAQRIRHTSGDAARVQGTTLRLSRYPDPMEPATAQRLRSGFQRAADELTAAQSRN